MRDLIIVIVAIVALWFVWLATGGPESERAQGGPFLKPLAPLDTGETFGPGDSSRQNGEKSRILDEVRITGVGSARVQDPQQEYIVIQAAHTNGSSVRIDNWSLRNKQGEGFIIGEASNTPYQGIVNRENRLYLEPGDRAYVVSGNSPIGVSFQLNACSSYLEQFQDFSPSISRSCPSASTDALRSSAQYSRACVNFISSLPECEIYLGEFPDEISNQCISFVQNKKTHNGCVDAHKHDPSFRKPEWRVYLRQNTEIWNNTSDLIRLYDEDGRLIDSLSY